MGWVEPVFAVGFIGVVVWESSVEESRVVVSGVDGVMARILRRRWNEANNDCCTWRVGGRGTGDVSLGAGRGRASGWV